MKYYQIDIETSETGIEAAVGKLLSIGIEDTEVSDPRDIQEIMDKKESYEWDYIDGEVTERMKETPRVTVYTEDPSQAREIRTAIGELAAEAAEGMFGPGADLGSLEVTVTEQDDSLWKDRWKEYFHPFRVSERIVIRPTWEPLPAELADAEAVIEIDPGMAFGTGTHETTAMCIQMLEEYVKPGMRVLDAGCGSGILSIAAAKLGAAEVLGVDIDETAVEVAKANLVQNGVDSTAGAAYGDVTEGVDFTADLVVANLMAELICMITPDIPAHLAPGGVFITSGILTEKKEMVVKQLRDAGFAVDRICDKEEWCCIAARLPEKDGAR
ncbi:ribosomal protein L11 methyltransferase [Hornefia porci]|uniref:Ribosomal protein L11 methyltransferase n=1 Tax=Hornefia porci TaxID=2652292 RepID=A0A1Q9JGF6_9FIRM|nr:50S ribosomal protein L11 methyltransferase [Hornefia porci]OLR55322.1 ribosomal protein L11 methyltransferase [Hornefia porci]